VLETVDRALKLLLSFVYQKGLCATTCLKLSQSLVPRIVLMQLNRTL
jgi:hypothetical protein